MAVLAQTESVFALANGHIGWRGNLDEGEPHGLPGSYLNGVYELRPQPYAEPGYGYPESGQTVVNVTNGKLIRLLVNDEPFDVTYGELRAHERCLDFRAGVLQPQRRLGVPGRVPGPGVLDPAGVAGAALDRGDPLRGRGPRPPGAGGRAVRAGRQRATPSPDGDPRVAAALEAPLVAEADAARGARAGLVHSTRHSGLRIAAVMDHVIDGPPDTAVAAESFEHLGRVTVTATLEPGQRLRLVKFVAYGWSGSRSLPAVRDQADAALAGATQTGWDGLLAEQRAYLDAFWDRADVQLDGDAEIQQAVRFSLFHVLQAGARAEGRAIAAKGLTGPGYDGHCFWDTEAYVLPMLTYIAPDTVAHALRWRHSTLPMATAAGPPARAARRGVPVAHHPRRRMLGLLAGRHGRVPHQRRHRRRRDRLPRRHRRRHLRRGRRTGAAGRDGAAVALAGPPRRRGPVPDRRGHRPRRVQRGCRQQHLHQPDGPAEPARRRRVRQPPPRPGP